MEIILPQYLKLEVQKVANQSPANKRKVGALIFDKDNKILVTGFNYNLTPNTNCCENSFGETFDTVIHAEASCIDSLYRTYGIVECSLLVTYSPCIECCKKIVNTGCIKNVFILEEHPVNFRTYQTIRESQSPLDFLLSCGINVYLLNTETEMFRNILHEKQEYEMIGIYHSADLDGWMCRYILEKELSNTVGYNYENDLEKRLNLDFTSKPNQKYHLVFADITPSIQYLTKILSKLKSNDIKISIYDHHEKALADIQKFKEENNLNNIMISEVIGSGCCTLYNTWPYAVQLNNLKLELLGIISNYDTWKWKELEVSKQYRILPIIESLKLISDYDDFKYLVDNISINNLSKLIEQGDIILKYQKASIYKKLSKCFIKKINGFRVIIDNEYPSAMTEECLTEIYQSENIVYISYNFDYVKNKILFSIRSYDSDVALKIATEFGGGGHKRAAGFTRPLNEFDSFFENDWNYLTDVLNKMTINS